MRRPHVCHVTSVHIALDGRIFYHECRSLASDYDVTLVCRDDGANRVEHGVRIVPATARSGGRLARWRDIGAVVAAAERTGADLFHFHDPELLSAMAALKRRTGRPVVYDVHEHYPLTVRLRSWIPAPARPLAAAAAQRSERRHAPSFDAIVTADDALLDRFNPLNRHTVCVRNYPPLALFAEPRPAQQHPPRMAYVGSLSAARGFHRMVAAARIVRSSVPDARLVLAGSPTEEVAAQVRRIARDEPGLVEFLGPVPYEELPRLLRGVDVGLSLLTENPKYHSNVPTKVFDYMAASVPYVASDFPPLRRVTAGAGGVLVPPDDDESAAAAILALLTDPARAEELGRAGRAAVEAGLNWEAQAQDLHGLYESLLAGRT